jgi:UDP-glucuronate 4-epimerase
MRVLVTGAAGFIGAALSQKLCQSGAEVFGLDNLSPYYNVQLKKDRLAQLKSHKNFQFQEGDIKDRETTESAFKSFKPTHIAHLAAQPGVRHSIENPYVYIDSNIVGFLNILEGCRHHKVEHLVYASSSSVYGANSKTPFSEHDSCEHPVSLYAATKKSNEMMAHSYAHTFGIKTTGLRFFTVYGPWGRPDMAAMLFTEKILKGAPITVFNHGKLRRDFTFVDDIVSGVEKVLCGPAKPNPLWQSKTPDPASSTSPYRIYNIGNQNPIPLMDFIRSLEEVVGKKAQMEFTDMAPGDVHETYASTIELEKDFGFRPSTELSKGLSQFFDWYRSYYKV